MTLSFSGLTVEQINQKLLDLSYRDVADLLLVYQCPIDELAGRIAQAQGLKVPIKKNTIDRSIQIDLCRRMYLEGQIMGEVIRSDKVIEGILKDIQNGIERIADAIEKKN